MFGKNKYRIAILLHTILRDKQLFGCLESIKNNLKDDYRLYITDSGLLAKEKIEIYNKLKEEGHKVLLLPFDTYPSVARNMIMPEIKERFVFKIDDDFRFEKGSFNPVLKFLDSKEKVGLVGLKVVLPNRVSDYIFNIIQEKERIRMKKEVPDWNIEHIHYHYCDMTPDCFIAKREIFDTGAGWDNGFCVGEGIHADFFINLKLKTDWKVVYTDSVHILHNKEIPNHTLYKKMRLRYGANPLKLIKKWQVKSIDRL